MAGLVALLLEQVAVMAARELHGAQVVVVVVERTRATWQAQAATADQAQ
jgi:hypothetical protein